MRKCAAWLQITPQITPGIADDPCFYCGEPLLLRPRSGYLGNYGYQPFHGEVAGGHSVGPKYGATIWTTTDRCGAPFGRAAGTGRRAGWLHPGEGRGQYRAAGAQAAGRNGANAEGLGARGRARPDV